MKMKTVTEMQALVLLREWRDTHIDFIKTRLVINFDGQDYIGFYQSVKFKFYGGLADIQRSDKFKITNCLICQSLQQFRDENPQFDSYVMDVDIIKDGLYRRHEAINWFTGTKELVSVYDDWQEIQLQDNRTFLKW